MDHWLGQVVTVEEVRSSIFTIEEDDGECEWQNGHWHWNARCVDCIADDICNLSEIDEIATEAIVQFIFSGV